MSQKRGMSFWKGSGKSLLILALGGALAGFCNGLLGAGGGIILVLALSILLPKGAESARSVYANALLVMLPLSCLTLYRYASGGAFSSVGEGAVGTGIVVGAMLGGIAGGVLLGRFRGKFLGRLFALLTLISGIIMLTR